MELPKSLMEKIETLSEDGNQLFDTDKYDAAIKKWEDALSLLPAPKNQWDAYVWLTSSIGDAYYQSNEFMMAKERLFDAENGPGGPSNPFIQYRLGQCIHRLGDTVRAVEYLLRAYMLDGDTIFNAEQDGDEFYEILLSRGLVPGSTPN